MHSNVALRQLEPNDGRAFAALFENSPDTGRIKLSPHYLIDGYQAARAIRLNTVGVVAETPDNCLIGTALSSREKRQVEGQVRECTLLSSLVVHPQYRRQGIASHILRRLIDNTLEQQGDKEVIFGGIQKNNIGSFSTVRKYLPQFVGRFHGVFVRTRTSPPTPIPGIKVQIAQEAELDEISQGLNLFYEDYNLYSPQTGETLAKWLNHTPFDVPYRCYYIAVDKHKNMLAGLAISQESKMRELHVQHMPGGVRLLNRFLKLVPSNGVMRQLPVEKVWYAPGQIEAARLLWELVRWEWRERGNSLICYYDPRSSLGQVFGIRPWMPKAELMLAFNEVVQINEDRFICPPS